MIIRLFKNELDKALHSKLTYFGMIGMILLCILLFIATKQSDDFGDSNGWYFVTFIAQNGMADVGLLFIIIFCSALTAEEVGTGTIRMVLSLPIARWKFYVAKALVGMSYMVCLTILVVVLSLILGALRYDYGNIVDQGGLIYQQNTIVINLMIAIVLDWLPLMSVVFSSIFISTLVRKGSQAIGLAVGLIIFIETTKHFIHIASFVFTTYIGESWTIFQEMTQGLDYQWFPRIWPTILTSLVYSTVTFTFGLLVLNMRDYNE